MLDFKRKQQPLNTNDGLPHINTNASPTTTNNDSNSPVIIDVWGLDVNWVNSRQAPPHKMPIERGISYMDKLPIFSPVSPLSWAYNECYTSQSLLMDFPSKSIFLAMQYSEDANIQKIMYHLTSDRFLVVNAWGTTTNGRLWELAYAINVRFLFADCLYEEGIANKLADIAFTTSRIHCNNAMARKAFGLTQHLAEEVFQQLLDYTATLIVQSAQQVFTGILEPEVHRFEQIVNKVPVNRLSAEVDSLIIRIIKGRCEVEDVVHEAQLLADEIFDAASALKALSAQYEYLTNLNTAMFISVDMTEIANTYKTLGLLEDRIAQVFNLMRR